MSLVFSRSWRAWRWAGAAALCFLLPCCGPSAEVTITQKRALPEQEQRPRTGIPSQERFRLALGMAGFGASQQDSEPSELKLSWKLPPGWKEATGNPMRQVDLRFGKDFQGECYLSRAGGSLADNVNRWRRQMGLNPLPEEEVAKLPKRPLLGKAAFQLSLDGDFSGMAPAETKKDYRMLGVILPLPDVWLFVKMIGPRAEVAANEANFQAFCDSLQAGNP